MKVDALLIREAQLLTTGAEIHETNEAIAMYRGASYPGTPPDAFQYFEDHLRQHVALLHSRRAKFANRCRSC